MDADTLNALGQLWKPILALALLIGLFLFRGPVAGFINRLKSVKVGDKELQANDKVDQNEGDIAVGQQIQEEPVADVDDDSEEASPTTGDAFSTMIDAFKDSNFTKAEHAYKEYRAEAQSDDERREIDAFYLHLRYIKAADSGALAKLRELASHTSTKTNVLRWLAYCYSSTKDYSKAREAYTEARDSADEINAALLTRDIADCWAEEGDPDQGLEEVILKLREVEQDDAKLHLYKSMASMYQAKGSKRMRAIALEKALQFAPRDMNIRFSAAYAQSQAKLSAVSITNYDTLLKLEPKQSVSQNNLGVECQGLGLRFNAVAYYKKAADEDNTLAMSNLAYLLMNMGFYKEADDELSRAGQLPNPHENVASAKVQLEKKRREELEKWNNVIEVGARQQQFLREFAQASIEETTGDPFLGPWRSPNGETCPVDRYGSLVCFDFSYAGEKRRFQADSRNYSAEGKLLLWKKEWYQDEGSFQEGADALAVVSSDGTTLSILELSDSSTVLQMTRISAPI